MPLLIVEGKRYRVGDLMGEDPLWIIPVDEKKVSLEVLRQSSAQPATLFVRIGGRVISVSIQRDENQHIYSLEVSRKPMTVTVEEDSLAVPTNESTTTDGPALVNSPMAGKIASVKASVNSKVEEGQSIMVLEAMKMQNEIASPRTGIVRELYVKHGDLVKAGDKLCLVE